QDTERAGTDHEEAPRAGVERAPQRIVSGRSDERFALGGGTLSIAWDVPRNPTGIQIGVRPGYVKVVPESGPNTFPGRLRGVSDHGAQRVLEVAGQLVRTKTPREEGVPVGEEVLVHLPRTMVLPCVDGRLVLRS
ncbi:hypothetical protein ABB07_38035, partial [Streptomyces incarnatus]